MEFVIFDSSDAYGICIIVLAVIVIGAGGAIYNWHRPPAWRKLLEDGRYRQARAVYSGNLQHEGPTCEDRQQALAVAITYLANEHGIPAEEAGPNLRLVAAEYDREQSFELRREASVYEQDGAYDLALDYYERAAQWQKKHDPKDYQCLQRCAARVRGKARPR